MKTSLTKFVILLMLISSLLACKNEIGEIIEAQKAIVFPGVKQAPIRVRYNAKIKLYKPVKLLNVNVINKEKSIKIENYKLKDIKTGKFLDSEKEIQPGEYLFGTEIVKPENSEKVIDKLEFIFLHNDKKHTIKTDVKIADQHFME